MYYKKKRMFILFTKLITSIDWSKAPNMPQIWLSVKKKLADP